MKNNNNLELAKNAKYEWNPGFRSAIIKTKIGVAIKELRQIEAAYGEINPLLILEASKNKKSLFHDYFEWDNDKAAHNWRVTQARVLLSGIQVKTIKDGKPVQMQAYQITKVVSRKIGESSYTKFDALPEDHAVYVQRFALAELMKVKNKLEASDQQEALPHIEKAIKILQKKTEVIDIR